MDTRSKVRKQTGKKADICGSCSKEVIYDCIQCEGKCGRWFHAECSGLSELQFKELAEDEDSEWSCQRCGKEEKSNEDEDENPIAGAIRKLRRQVEESIQPSTPTSKDSETVVEEAKECCFPGHENVRDPSHLKLGSWNSWEVLTQCEGIYGVIVKWRRNIFLLPSGAAGKAFIEEMTKVANNFTAGSAMESVAMTLLMIMPSLLLQKPSKRSKAKEHTEVLKRRLVLWQAGKLEELLREGQEIQRRMGKGKHEHGHVERVFTRLMMKGKVSAAMRWIGENATGILEPTPDVIKVLKEKHPKASPASKGSCLSGPVRRVEPVIFDSIDGELIRQAAKRVQGAAGPSGMDAEHGRDCWVPNSLVRSVRIYAML